MAFFSGEITPSVVEAYEKQVAEEQAAAAVAPPTDGPPSGVAYGPHYRLASFVTHVGKNANSGHYICHIRKEVDGKEHWVQFNDRKVALSKKPPLGLGFIYLFVNQQE